MCSALWWRVAISRLARTTRLRRSLQSFEAEVLHTRLLLVIPHVEGVITTRTLCLKLQFCRLWYGHLVVSQSSSSSVAHARVVAAVVVAHIE